MRAIKLKIAWLIAGVKVQYFDKGIHIDTLLRGGIQFALMYYFWKAVFSSTDLIGGRDFGTYVTYLMLSLYLQWLMGYPNIHFIGRDIKTGAIVNALIRPMDYGVQMRYKNIGIALFNALLFSPFLIFISGRIGLKGSLSFLLLGTLGTLTYIQFDIFMAYFTFWTENGWGIALLKNGILMFFSGKLFPTDLLGPHAYALIKFSPFPGMIFRPIQVALNGGDGLLGAAVTQCVWVGVLIGLSHFLFHRAQKDVMINGG